MGITLSPPPLRSFLLTVLLLFALSFPSDTLAAPDGNKPNAPASPPSHRFPHNLHRLYDGTWESVSHTPFSTVPRPPSPHPTPQPPSAHNLTTTRFPARPNIPPKSAAADPDAVVPVPAPPPPQPRQNADSSTDGSAGVPAAVPSPISSSSPSANSPELAFRKKSGFALLTADNHRSALGPSISIVFGELLLRDGVYRSPRDVSLRLIGVYDSKLGTLVVVGDVLFEDISSALQRLYDAFVRARPRPPRANASTPRFNVTEEAFIAALTPTFAKHRKQFPAQRSGPTRAATVAAQCPFSASFSVTPGKFDDSTPPDADISVGTPFASVPGAATGAGAGAAAPQAFFSGRADETEDSVASQQIPVEMKGIFKSPACSTKMSITLSTLDTETLFGKAINYTLLVTIVAFLQVIVLIRQMEMTSTQAGARRVSLMTVGLQAVADSYLCLGHLTMGIAVQTLFNAFATAAFFKFICFSIFLMRWMLLIWKARRPSGFSEGWEAMRRELSLLYTRFYGSLLVGILLLYQMQNHLRFFLFALYSFWLPQIVLNVVEDHRRPLLPTYIVATSITRLAIPLYFWGCPRNFLHIQPRPMSAIALVCWLMFQALLLLSQYKFGPRWFIPKKFLPEKYDYYRPITVEDDVFGSDIEAGTGESDGPDGEARPLMGEPPEPRRECCICMESVAVHSRERMVTPCNHFFHAACLERWLEVRLECALCRSPVPPP